MSWSPIWYLPLTIEGEDSSDNVSEPTPFVPFAELRLLDGSKNSVSSVTLQTVRPRNHFVSFSSITRRILAFEHEMCPDGTKLTNYDECESQTMAHDVSRRVLGTILIIEMQY